MKVEELIKLINNNKDLLSLDDVEDFIFGSISEEPEIIAKGLYEQKHRWYSTAVDIYKCEDGFVGVRGGYIIFAESSSWEDMCVSCVASEYEEKPSVTYVPKKF